MATRNVSTAARVVLKIKSAGTAPMTSGSRPGSPLYLSRRLPVFGSERAQQAGEASNGELERAAVPDSTQQSPLNATPSDALKTTSLHNKPLELVKEACTQVFGPISPTWPRQDGGKSVQRVTTMTEGSLSKRSKVVLPSLSHSRDLDLSSDTGPQAVSKTVIDVVAGTTKNALNAVPPAPVSPNEVLRATYNLGKKRRHSSIDNDSPSVAYATPSTSLRCQFQHNWKYHQSNRKRKRGTGD